MIISGKSAVVIYNIYSPEGIHFFRGRRVNSYFEGRTHKIQLIKPSDYNFFLKDQSPNQL